MGGAWAVNQCYLCLAALLWCLSSVSCNVYHSRHFRHCFLGRPVDFYFRQRRRYMFSPCLFVCLSVCLSVSKITQKTRTWIWMKCCVSTDVGTWMNWLTFEPDLDYSPDNNNNTTTYKAPYHVHKVTTRAPRTRLLSPISYRLRNFAALPIGCQRAALLREILRRENPTYTYWRRAASILQYLHSSL